MKFHTHRFGKEHQTVTHDVVKDHIAQCAQKTCKNGQDIAASLQDLKKMDLSAQLPQKQLSQEAGAQQAMIRVDWTSSVKPNQSTAQTEKMHSSRT